MSEEKTKALHQVVATAIDVSMGGDAGAVFRFWCPNCQMQIRWAQLGWWDTTCKCGLKWEVEVTATGRQVK